jgi:hypothetical protein
VNPPTEEDVLRGLEAAVAAQGEDFVYPRGEEGWGLRKVSLAGQFSVSVATSCVYVRTDVEEPACAFGFAFHYLGVPLAELKKWEGSSAGSLYEKVFGESPSHRLAVAMRVGQNRQDGGATWGEVLRVFKKALGIEP